MTGFTISGPDGLVFSLPRHATVRHDALDEAVKERRIADYKITSVDFTQDPPAAEALVKPITPIDHINISLLVAKDGDVLSVSPLPKGTNEPTK